MQRGPGKLQRRSTRLLLSVKGAKRRAGAKHGACWQAWTLASKHHAAHPPPTPHPHPHPHPHPPHVGADHPTCMRELSLSYTAASSAGGTTSPAATCTWQARAFRHSSLRQCRQQCAPLHLATAATTCSDLVNRPGSRPAGPQQSQQALPPCAPGQPSPHCRTPCSSCHHPR